MTAKIINFLEKTTSSSNYFHFPLPRQSQSQPTNSKLINQLHRQISHRRGEDFLHTTRDAAAIEIIGDA
jgi:hypothetical protein